MHRSNTTTN
jgi:hypothetical protein